MDKWLQQEFVIWTNQEIVEMSPDDRASREYLKEWFNPFEQPELLDRERQESGMKPMQWRKYVIDNYPGIDPTEQFRKRKQEVGDTYRIERVKRCRMVVTVISPETGEPEKKRLPPCKQYDICPDCAKHRADDEIKKLMKLQGKGRVLIIPRAEEAKAIRNLDQDYLRYPIGEDQTAIVIITDDKDFGEVLDFHKCQMLGEACSTCENSRRVTGKLVIDEEEKEDKEGLVRITRRRMQIEYPDREQEKKIHEMAKEGSGIDHSPTNEDELQWSIYVLEQQYRIICDKLGVLFNFVDTEVIFVDMNSVKWKWVGKRCNSSTL